METVQNSMPLWLVLALTTSYAFSKIPIDPGTMSFFEGLGAGTAVALGIKYLLKR